MHQLTLRVGDQLAADLKRAAEGSGRSVNSYCTAVLQAAVDPDLAGNEAERVRERLRRAGLLADTHRLGTRPRAADVAAARRAAGGGRDLSELVDKGR